LKKSNYISILENSQQINSLETIELKAIVEEFPYFQSARALYLKALKEQDSFKYNNELKVTAAHTKDRTVLFNYITDFNTQKESIHQQISEKITEEEVKSNLIKPTETIHRVEEKLEIGKPISFSPKENYSFNQWLQLSAKKPIVRSVVKEVNTSNEKENLIDQFIQNNPKIKPLAKDKTITAPVAQNKEDSSLMTETLAKVYLEQKKYENAMQAYRILSLKYPEKSGFFADQIKRIQILQKNKT
jgi:hypothetical protein